MGFTAKTNWRNNDIVMPDDLNRIERGVAEAASPSDDVILWVSSEGNDDTGVGDGYKPFRTIQKAIDSFSTSNNLGKLCVIKVAEGQYTGFTLSAYKRIEISAQGPIQILGDIVITAGILTFVEETGAELYLVGGRISITGGTFMSMITTGITTPDQSTPYDGIAVDCAYGAKFGVQADLIITHHTTAIKCAYSHMTLRRLMTDNTATGVVCECGIVHIGDDVIQATTKFISQQGGRIYVGAQTNIPNY